MPDIQSLIWLYLQFRGRVDRAAYFLAGALLYLARLYPGYKMVENFENRPVAESWAGVLIFVVAVALLPHLALTAKRLHDMGRSGWWSIFFVLGDIFVFIALCLPPGTPGPNRFGRTSNAPG